MRIELSIKHEDFEKTLSLETDDDIEGASVSGELPKFLTDSIQVLYASLINHAEGKKQ